MVWGVSGRLWGGQGGPGLCLGGVLRGALGGPRIPRATSVMFPRLLGGRWGGGAAGEWVAVKWGG